VKKEKIDKLYNHILQGGIITDDNVRILIKKIEFKPYISWEHYGRSAIKFNKKEFRWMIEVIFEDYEYDEFVLTDYEEYYQRLDLKYNNARKERQLSLERWLNNEKKLV